VQDTIEFVLSVHPSNAGRKPSPNTGKGAGITHEALNAASRLISSPPLGMSPEEWFTGISPQLLALLDGDGQPEIDRAAAFIIGFGILGRKQFGAPGMPGWKAFVDPILDTLDSSLTAQSNSHGYPDTDPIITLGTRKILVSSQNIAQSLRRLSTLLTSHPNPSLTKRVLNPILLPLWAISYWPHGNQYTETAFRNPARKLLKILIQLLPATKPSPESNSQTSNVLVTILRNLAFKGRPISSGISWTYSTTKDGGIQIVEVLHQGSGDSATEALDFERVEFAVDCFIAFLGELPDMKSETANLFVELCTKWLTHTSKVHSAVIIQLESKDDAKDVETRLIEAKVMQKMMTAFPDKLVDDTRQVLDLVNQVLADFIRTNCVNEDSAAVALSLLNIIVTTPSFRHTSETDSRLTPIQKSLQVISRKSHLEVSSTAKNLLMFLSITNTIEDPDTAHLSTLSDRQIEDRKSYSLAMQYLTAVDSPPPVRVQGLELISGLISSGSSILDIPALLVLFSSLLQDSEEYIYLRAIKSFIHLSQKHPRAVMKDLVDRYVDPNEDYDLDQRLRLGEGLLQVIQNNHLAFTGNQARSVCQGLLFIAGRRGRRPKTEKVQERKNKLKRKQNSEAEEAWGGPVPQLDEVLEESSGDHELISEIVLGWESKRGTEDIRIRASALSILGSGIESNIKGLDSQLLSASIDLAIHILTLEPEAEKGILRRAAILLIMSFIKALSLAREAGEKPVFGIVGESLDDVKRVLEYVESTDNDGLVRQHARDVVESLVAWHMEVLLPARKQSNYGELKSLAGLQISPIQSDEQSSGGSGAGRPRIEEIE
jgi:hypothetical protein